MCERLFASVIRQAWAGAGPRASADAKLVHAVVKRLRDKLGEDAARPNYIQNERGVGYRTLGPGDPPVRAASSCGASGRTSSW